MNLKKKENNSSLRYEQYFRNLNLINRFNNQKIKYCTLQEINKEKFWQFQQFQDSDLLINILKNTSTVLEALSLKIEQSLIISQNIQQIRERYRKLAKRAQIIFFVIQSLQSLNSMYQNSLETFILVFKYQLEYGPESPKNFKDDESIESQKHQEIRLEKIKNTLTYFFCQQISRGLFDKDIRTFMFLLAYRCDNQENHLDSAIFQFFLNIKNNQTQTLKYKCPTNMSAEIWQKINDLSYIEVQAKEFMEDIQNQPFIYERLMAYQNIIEAILPKQEKINPFVRFLLLFFFKPQQLQQISHQYVGSILGDQFKNIQVLNIFSAYKESTIMTPILFIMAQGADPLAILIKIMQQANVYKDQVNFISLGQGQGQKAEECIKNAKRLGKWVFLQNCHLSTQWLSNLEKIIDKQVESDIAPGYRLWLTSLQSEKIPIQILQKSIKVALQRPISLKKNLIASYQDIKPNEFDENNDLFRRIFFQLSIFHAVIMGRKNYGSLGWNCMYDWIQADFNYCLNLFNEDQQKKGIKYEDLIYFIGNIIYGGRITDRKDNFLLLSILELYIQKEAIEEDLMYKLYDTQIRIQDYSYDSILEWINRIPDDDIAQMYCLTHISDIQLQNESSKYFNLNREFIDLLNRIYINNVEELPNIQPKVEKIKSQLWSFLNDIEYKQLDTFSCLHIFRNQEIQRYNNMIQFIKITLLDVIQSFKGNQIMNKQLEQFCEQINQNKVPDIWKIISFSTEKHLNSWIEDLKLNIQFFRQWCLRDMLKSYKLSAFYFPQGFFTSIKQQFSRQFIFPIDKIELQTKVQNQEFEPALYSNSVCIHDLFLQGACLDQYTQQLVPNDSNQAYVQLGYIQIIPLKEKQIDSNQQYYSCPVFKTASRGDNYWNSIHSSNYIINFDLSTAKDQKIWVRYGIAMFAQTPN